MKVLFSFLFCSIGLICSAQSIEDLEFEMGDYEVAEEWDSLRITANRILEVDISNKWAISSMLFMYYELDQSDSTPVFWDKLFEQNPDNQELLLIRWENSNYEGLSSMENIDLLHRAYSMNRKNEEVVYALGTCYYEYFIDSNSAETAAMALEFFDSLCAIDTLYESLLKTPCIQLSNYIGDVEKLDFYSSYSDRYCHFTILDFANLKKGWEHDYQYNVMQITDFSNRRSSGVTGAANRLKHYSKHLQALEEPIIYDTISKCIMRFTWLRTFHHPVVIRVDYSPEKSYVSWKMSSGRGGYDPGKIIINKSKVLNDIEVKSIINGLDSLDFYSLRTATFGFASRDGAHWILEVLKDGNYHVVDRKGGVIEPFCLKLLNLTSLNIKAGEIY